MTDYMTLSCFLILLIMFCTNVTILFKDDQLNSLVLGVVITLMTLLYISPLIYLMVSPEPKSKSIQ